ncbi:MAG TPA: class II aldolase/adducin family protein [Homoserinimonas sp.]|nr:class II aldolase/adducin family protein [Homoserinimonas sp.]
MTDRSTEAAIRQLIIDTCRRLADTKLVYGTAGNVSARLGDRILISPSTVPYDELTPELICEVRMDGTVPPGQPARASSETPLHLELYRSFDAAAVVHVHSPAAVAAGLITAEIPPVHYMIRQFGGPVRVADYATFGSTELAANVQAAMTGRTAALMRNHGAVAVGSTLDEAFERCAQLEWLCDVYLRARSAGTPRALPEEELRVVADAAAERGYRL